MKVKYVLNILGICFYTLYNYVKQGKLKINSKYSRTFYNYDDGSIYMH